MTYIIIKHKSKSKSIVFGTKNFFFCAKKPFYMMYIGWQKHVY